MEIMYVIFLVIDRYSILQRDKILQI